MPRVNGQASAHISAMRTPIRKLTLEFIAALGLTLGAILATAADARANDIQVTRAFARASVTPAAKTGAVYVVLRNTGSAADRLTAITTPAAATAQLHESRLDGDVMKMEAVESLDIAPAGTVEMKPGGLHIMLMGLAKPLAEGQSIAMVFHFERSGDVPVDVPVASMAATAP